ncbi:MAG TPA: VCBS repeat-containing protein, partial [Candidatus Limnocylindrales bacterium]
MSQPSLRARIARMFVAASLLAVTVVPTVGALAVPGVALATSCIDSWQPVTNFPSNLSGLDAQGAAAVNGTPGWIVGLSSAQSESKRVPLIAQWNGTSWVRVSAPYNGFGVLNAVQATNASHAWTVGSKGSYTRWPIAAVWNGTSWSDVAVPKPTGQLATFADLSLIDQSRFWAVGAHLVDGYLKPVAMKKRPTSWLKANPPIAANSQGGLSDVTIAPDGTVWAGGWKTDANGDARPWVTYRVGSTWQTSTLAPVPAGRGSVMDLSFRTTSDAWAAGWIETDGGGGYQPFLEHWNGTSWTVRSTPWANNRSIILNAVDVEPTGRLVVAGMQIDINRQDITAVLNGSTWTVTSLSAGGPGRSAMMDTVPLSSGTMVVGYFDNQPATLLPCSVSQPSSPGQSLGNGSEQAADIDTDEIDESGPDPIDSLNIDTTDVPGTVALDETAAAGLTLKAPSWGGVVADFNNDSYPDVFINRHYQDVPLMMMNSASSTFTPLDADFADRDRHRCDAADVDQDGTLDLFCAIGVNKGTSNTPQEFTLDPGDAGGTWASTQFGVLDGYGRGRDATFIDLNGDQYPDLYIGNEASRSDAMLSSNRLYINNGGTGFVSAASWGVDLSVGANCMLDADVNGDGKDDLLMCTAEPLGSAGSGARVFINQGSSFSDQTSALGLAGPGVSDMAVADFNGDGKLDVAELNGKGLKIYSRSGSTFSQLYSLTANAGVKLAVGDVNADGHPDIYVSRRTAGNTGHLMLVNNGNGTSFTSMTIPQP